MGYVGWVLVGLTGGLLLMSCDVVRESDRVPQCIDYRADVAPLLADACVSCHGPDVAEGGYRLDSYKRALALNSNSSQSRVEPSTDGTILLLTKAQGDEGHPKVEASALAVLERWAIECGAGYFSTDVIHPRGWVNPGDSSFHGRALRQSGWDFDACAKCHGAPDDPTGGPGQLGCTRCHEKGATDCSTCHGDETTPAPPASVGGSFSRHNRGVGAHRIHLTGGARLGVQVACDSCHIVPTSYDSPGHILLADGTPDPWPAEVTFGPLATRNLAGFDSKRTAEAAYDSTHGTCSNVYCHGGALGGTPGWIPVWNDTTSAPAGCGLCHEAPPSSPGHPTGDNAVLCEACHSAVAGPNQTLVDPSLHMDGQLFLGDGSQQCTACHGSNINPAPPRGLQGESTTAEAAVGAHQSHLTGTTFRAPLPCNSCHTVPGATFAEAVMAKGHIDGDLHAEVFHSSNGAPLTGLSASLGPGLSLASEDNTDAVYNHTTATCSDVYCHGNGLRMGLDMAPQINRTLDWRNAGKGLVVCGSCHGLPPDQPGHPQSVTLTQCYLCHPVVIDSAGDLIFEADGSTKHLNGKVDFAQ